MMYIVQYKYILLLHYHLHKSWLILFFFGFSSEIVPFFWACSHRSGLKSLSAKLKNRFCLFLFIRQAWKRKWCDIAVIMYRSYLQVCSVSQVKRRDLIFCECHIEPTARLYKKFSQFLLFFYVADKREDNVFVFGVQNVDHGNQWGQSGSTMYNNRSVFTVLYLFPL